MKALIEKSIRTETENAIRRYDRYHVRIADAVEELNAQAVELEEAMAKLCNQNNDEPSYRASSLKVQEQIYQLYKIWRRTSVYLSDASNYLFREIQKVEKVKRMEVFSIIIAMQNPQADIDALIERKVALQISFENEFNQLVVRFQSELKEDLRRG